MLICSSTSIDFYIFLNLPYLQLLAGLDIVALDAIQLTQLGNGRAITLGNLRECLSFSDGD